MDFLIQLLISGAIVGCIYAVVAVGFVTIYKATGILNFATGEFMMIGAYLAYTAMSAGGSPFFLAVALALIGLALLALLVERVVLRPLFGEPMISVIMVTLGLSAMLKGLAQILWSADFLSFPPIFPRAPIQVASIIIPSRMFYGFLIALAAVGAVWAIFRFTRSGVAMRATATDQGAAYACGVDIRRVFGFSWALGAMAAAAGGIVVGIIGGIGPQLGHMGIKVFPAVILGGLDSIGGAVLGGILIGVLENLAGGYLDPHMTGGSVKEVVPFVVLLVILMVKPYGLFGTREIERL